MLTIFVFLSSIIVLYFNLQAYIKNKKAPVNQAFAIFGLAIFFWLLCYGFGYLENNLHNKLFLFRLGYVGVIAIPVTFFNFIINLIGIKGKRIDLVKILLFFIYFVFVFINFTGEGFLNSLIKYPWGYYPAATPILHPILLVFFNFVFSGSIFLLFLGSYTGIFKLKPLQRIRVKYVFWGSLTGVMGSMDFVGSYGLPKFYPLGFIFMILYPIIFGYAIIKYRLMEINLVITRTGVFIAVYSLVLGIPFVIAYTLRSHLINFLGDAWWLVPMGLLTVLATVGPFIYIFVNSKAENRLMREQRRYQQTLRQASSGMIRVKELTRLLKLIVYVVTKTVKLEFTSIFLLDSENSHYTMVAKRGKTKFPTGFALKEDSHLVKYLFDNPEPIVYEEIQLQAQDNPSNVQLAGLVKELKDFGVAVIVPSFVGQNLLGFLVLGKKISGKLYSQDDLNVFSVLANQSALAIENAQFYEDIKETQEQLFQAEKMATIGTMADGLSHQINNRFQALSLIAGDSIDILNTTDVKNCSQEVKDSFGQLKHAFTRIQSNVMQGGEVVRGLLRYSRPGQAGFEAVNFNRIIDGALEMAQYKVRLKELDIKRNIPESLPYVRCNITQLQEVFFNLVDNAFDAIKEKQSILKDPGYKGSIEVFAFQEDGRMRIVFKDNGVGVKEKDKEKLFTPFFTTKATNRKGTGLGLYVIQKIIGHHDGTVFIDSTYMEGTKFEIVLPTSKKGA